MKDARTPLVVVVGPTASGKTELAVRLAEAWRGEIVSADSVQVYRHFDIGSGKPSPDELRRAPHHLIDVVEPDETIEASRFAELARAAIDDVLARGRVPIVCGGTFLWIRALLFGLVEAPPGDREVRARHAALAEKEGREALHDALARVDEDSAKRLHPRDFVRVSRALEVYELSGQKLSALQAEHGFRSSPYRPVLVGRGMDRDEYDRRVERRVRAMLDGGLVEEVRSLLERGYEATRAMNSVGYRQVLDALRAEAALDREALLGEIVRATRVFGRRQRTWLREEPVEWVSDDQLDDAERWQALVARLERSLSRGATDAAS